MDVNVFPGTHAMLEQLCWNPGKEGSGAAP